MVENHAYHFIWKRINQSVTTHTPQRMDLDSILALLNENFEYEIGHGSRFKPLL